MNVSTQEQGTAIAGAATKWQVPLQTLVGVYGVETTYGSNINTSSTGAVGAFQFEPGTAAQYHYPLTNNPTPAQFAQQADAAAHYLHDLYAQTGKNWNHAAAAYYAGPGNIGAGSGYASQVGTAFAKAPQALLHAIGQAVAGNVVGSNTPTFGVAGLGPQAPAGTTPPGTTVTGPLSGPDIAGQLGRLVDFLTTGSNWIRLGEALFGAFLLFLGIHAMLGGDPVSTARKVVRR